MLSQLGHGVYVGKLTYFDANSRNMVHVSHDKGINYRFVDFTIYSNSVSDRQ
jgi:hypothetical protein